MKIVLDDGAFMPTRAHPDDAGLDIKSPKDVYMIHGASYVIDTGIRVQIPKGYSGQLKSKSGLLINHNISSGEGLIDSGYTGTIKVYLRNNSPTDDYQIKRGDKITQLVIQAMITPELEVVDSLEDTERGENGFGSSGR